MNPEEIEECIEQYKGVSLQKGYVVTVFLTTHKRPTLLLRMINSLLCQSYSSFSLVVLDNVSKDSTSAIVKSIHDPRIVYIERESKPGSSNFQFAFDICVTKYLFVVHDDDYVEPDYVETLVRLMEENPDIAALGSGFVGERLDGTRLNDSAVLAERGGEISAVTGNRYLLSWIDSTQPLPNFRILFPTIIYRNSFFRPISNFLNPAAGSSGDIFLFFEIGRQGGTLGVISDPLYHYTVSANQESSVKRPILWTTLFSFLLQQEYYRPFLIPRISFIGHYILLCAKDTVELHGGGKGTRKALIANYRSISRDLKRGMKNRFRCLCYWLVVLCPNVGLKALLSRHPEWRTKR